MRALRIVATLGIASLMAAGCNKGSGTTTSTSNSGIALPQELSALPPKSAGSTGQTLRRSQALTAAGSKALATDAGTDYSAAATVKFVNEQELSQFDILNVIFKAVGQTHYADAVNVNQGKYGANVSWEEDHGGDGAQKRIVSWIVDSSIVVENGRTANRLLTWMKMPMGDDGQLHLITVQLDIYEAPTQNADGTYSDYGVWTLDASLGAGDSMAPWYFAASANRDASGVPVVMIHQLEKGQETRGILKRSAASGYGQIEAPDDHNCSSRPCPIIHVAYAYDADHVALSRGANTTTVFKSRSDVVEVVEKYGLYDAGTGQDVAKLHHFGFPIRYTDGNGNQQWGSYGAWMGRHQLWTNGQAIPENTQVSKADVGSGEAKTYTTSKQYLGILVKRTLVASNVSALTNVPLQTWDNNTNSPVWIKYKNGGWVKEETTGNTNTWPPAFTGTEIPYAFPSGSMYLNSTGGASFVVTKTGPGAYDVKVEIQEVATPKNASDFDGRTFTQQWSQGGASTFIFSAAAFALEYRTVGQDAPQGTQVGDPVAKGYWGLVGSDGVQYNWEYPDAQNQCGNCGVQQFLRDGSELVLLDNPIQLAPLALTNRGGETQTYSLQFDGNWINGLPNLWTNNSFNLDAAATLSVAMPTTPVAGADGTSYLFKPLRVSEYLLPIGDPSDPGLDLTAANALDLSTVPTHVDHNLGDWPAGVAVKYSEGQLVQ